MTRSKLKLNFVHRSQFPKHFYNVKKKQLRRHLYGLVNEKGVKIGPFYFFWKRGSVINKKLLNKRFVLYNGYLFHVIRTTYDNLGYRLGMFTVTRKSVIHKGKQRQKKKREKSKLKELKSNKYTSFLKEKKKTGNKKRIKK